MTIHLATDTGTACGLLFGDEWADEAITDPDEIGDVTCQDCRPGR